MTAARINEDNFFAVLSIGSWLLLLLLTGGGWLFGSPQRAAGIAAGGLLAIVNYYSLHSVLKRLLLLKPVHAGRYVQIRYLARLALTAAVVYLLIVHGHIDIFGLLIGLSVVVFAIMSLSFYLLINKGE
ncbi:MAG TPA: ATP synthase subunit I [Geobacteraceae bacterium]|nr:ATP synthase subunit I [Geobacteraceae bacterium]